VPVIPVVNKGDLLEKEQIKDFCEFLGEPAYLISAKEGTGLEDLVGKIKGLKRSRDLG